jgi:hypothetical protein
MDIHYAPGVTSLPKIADNVSGQADLSFRFLEPTPNWDDAIMDWGWGWPVHIYGFSVLFVYVSVVCVISDIAISDSGSWFYP